MQLLPLLHRPPDLRGRALDRRSSSPALIAMHRAADQRVPRSRAADRRRARRLSRRQPDGARRNRRRRRSSSRSTASRTCSTCRRRPRPTACMHADRHVQARHRPRHGAGAGAEPREPGAAQAARGSAPARRHDRKSSPDLTMVVHLVSPDEPLRPAVPPQLRRRCRCKDVLGAHAGRRRGRRSSAAATTPCASGSTRRSSRRAT